jgi:pimeloyl-ACP methyl ester carboxylesterase
MFGVRKPITLWVAILFQDTIRNDAGTRVPRDNFPMPTISTSGISLHYEIHGAGEPLLFLHGGGGIGNDWQFLGKEWPFQLISPDLPEHGHSSGRPGPWTHRAAAQDVFALLDKLNIHKIKAVGISMGGNTLLHMATSQPDRIEAIVVVSGTSYFGPEARKFMREFSIDALPEALRNFTLARHPGGEAQARALFDRARAFADVYDDMNFTPPLLGTIQARTLIVYGDRDPLYPVEIAVEMYRAIPRAELWVVPNGAHGPVFGEAAPDFLKTATRFLR